MVDAGQLSAAKAVVRDVFGIDLPTDAADGEPPSAADFRAAMVVQAFGGSWSRDAIDDKTRSMLTVAIVATLGADRELRSHVGGALGLGVTPEQIVDIMIHVGAYAGAPRASAAFSVASEVMAKAARRAGREKTTNDPTS
ncbi:MAG TPA: carboxymuconolactone decarboxylase family protein [Mycobacteriales bacterium]|jgi:4-carboxymuconolactone decarboxylase|nr:carboxymuconolactone decarboxylase family protein [Mycobacteriales bacterium]